MKKLKGTVEGISLLGFDDKENAWPSVGPKTKSIEIMLEIPFPDSYGESVRDALGEAALQGVLFKIKSGMLYTALGDEPGYLEIIIASIGIGNEL